MHRKSPIQQALWASAKFFCTDSAPTLFLIQVVVDNAVHPTQKVSQLNRSVVSDKEICLTQTVINLSTVDLPRHT